MEYRFLGASGLKISALSFGSWVTFHDQMDEETARQCMTAAYDAGVNFFDTAEVYSGGRAEIMLGNVIRKAGWKRSDLVISTKIYWGGDGPNDKGLSRKHILEGINASLNRLSLEYVDMIFCHRPDSDTPIEETVRAMSHVVNQGKALYWGTSEWSRDGIRAAYDIARREHLVPPTMEQPQYNMFHRERVEKEYLPLYSEIGLGTTVWSPLAGGLLTGKYSHGIPQETRATLRGYEWIGRRLESAEGKAMIKKAAALAELAKQTGISMPQLALAWCLVNPYVSSVITGASRPQQVKENLEAMRFVEFLTPELRLRIEKILDNKPLPESNFR